MPTFLLSVLVPIIADFLKGAGPAASRKLFGESVDDQIKLANLDVERLKALGALDTPGGVPSLWVVNLRASFRYIAAAGLIAGGLGMILAGVLVPALAVSLVPLGIDLASAPFGFIFGERLVLNRRQATGK